MVRFVLGKVASVLERFVIFYSVLDPSAMSYF